MRRLGGLIVLASLILLPTTAFAATFCHSGWWTHQASSTQCQSDAQAAFAIAGLSNVQGEPSTGRVWGQAGDYAATVSCVQQIAVMTVAGPDAGVAASIYTQISNAWH